MIKKVIFSLTRDFKRFYNNLFKAKFFIYQMGKVGSSTLYKSIPNAAQFHNFDTDTPQKYFAPVEERLYQRLRWKFWFFAIKFRIKYLKLKNQKIKFISIARDPIARNISGYFQTLEGKKNKLDMNISSLRKDFLNNTNHLAPLVWFDKELNRHFGIDIYKYPFNKEKGYIIIKEKNYEVFLVTLESLSKNLTELEEYINFESLDLSSENRATNKWYSNLYKDFKNKVDIPENYIKKMYNSKYTNYFYSDEQIDKFKHRWQ